MIYESLLEEKKKRRLRPVGPNECCVSVCGVFDLRRISSRR